jgi:N-methylhydantoinase A
MGYKLGVDVGGTFTDFLVVDDAGASRIFKSMTTPRDPSIGFFDGLERAAADHGVGLDAFLAGIDTIVHGTTITTNATLTGNGARTGFLTTRGFRDLLNMRRGVKTGERYDLVLEPPAPLVPRVLTFPISERVDAGGDAIAPLAEDEVRAAARELRHANVEAVAVSYLWSFLNPAHEQRTRAILETELPGVYVSLSCEVLPQIRAYERHSTTALNAYVGPLLARYLDSLRARLNAHGFRGRLLIMQSNGGVMSLEVTRRFAVNTLLSGPAGGPGAGIHYARTHGVRDLISVDMGGTSFDVALIQNETPVVTSENEVGGYHVGVPMLDIHTVGAGGGSIAWVDSGGILHVGPQSAGADPGPACYGRGGRSPTVTDADLLLGYLDADYFHGGQLRLDRAAAEHAIRTEVADRLGLSVIDAAWGIYRVANSIMSAAVSVVTIQRGHDPRDFAMVVAGGAGPIHAIPIARDLGIGTLLVPRESSVFCAAGMLLSDLKHSHVRTYAAEGGELDLARVARQLEEMTATARATLTDEGVARAAMRFAYSADLRYVGQFQEVEVEGFAGGKADAASWETIVAGFHDRHDTRYGYRVPGAPVELINLRLTARGVTAKPATRVRPLAGGDPAHARKGERQAWFAGGHQRVPVYDGLALEPGNRIDGPAIVEQPTTTIVVTPQARLECDRAGNYVVTLEARSGEPA